MCLQSQALGHNMWHLLCSRLGLAVAESVASPVSYALIAAYFPSRERGGANGIYACGVYIGGGLASLSIVMARQLGWRMTCVVVGALGVGFAFVMLLSVREPVGNLGLEAEQQQQPNKRSLDDSTGQSSFVMMREDSALLDAEITVASDATPKPKSSPSNRDISQMSESVEAVLLDTPNSTSATSPHTVGKSTQPEPVLSLSQSIRVIIHKKAVILMYIAGCMRCVFIRCVGLSSCFIMTC